jgi:hypothetical protein
MGAHAVTPDRLVELGTAYRRAKVLLSAIELDLFTVLAKRSLDAHALALALDLHPRGARDFFDALVALGLLERSPEGRYASTPESAAYLDRQAATFLGGMFDQFNTKEYGMWATLTDALRTGTPQTGIDAAEHFSTLYSDPQRFETFVNAMTAGTLPAAGAIAEKFPWAGYSTLADIGTSQGCLPVQVARTHKHISATGFDLPQLQASFDAHVGKNELSDRVLFAPGNFFDDALPKADVLVFGRVLHNWDLSTKRMLLRKAYDALPERGAVIVYDALIDDDRRAGVGGLLSSLNMLVWTTAGFGYSGSDAVSWMGEAGFHDMRIEPLAAGQSMIVGTK